MFDERRQVRCLVRCERETIVNAQASKFFFPKQYLLAAAALISKKSP